MELKTPLYDAHVKAGGKMVPFAGYILPVQYKAGVIKEHMAVRQEAGLFDVSHMGEILCEGEKALENLQHLLTNDFTNMVDGQARYSPMCNEHGGTVDDLIVYKKADDHYFIVVNAANKDKDFQWMLDHQLPGATFTDAVSYTHLDVYKRQFQIDGIFAHPYRKGADRFVRHKLLCDSTDQRAVQSAA